MFGDTRKAWSFKESEIADLVWVCDLDEARAKRAAEKYGCKYTTHPEDIAQDPNVRVVGIATPDFAHREVSLLMIDAKKDVLIEKPLATNIADATAIVNEVKKMGVRMATDFQNRWNPPFVEAKKAIEGGALGYPVSAYVRLCNSIQINQWLSWTAKSGPQWFLCPHIVDLVRWLFQQETVKVFASGRREILKKIGVDTYNAIQAQLVFPNAFATIETAWILPASWPGLDFRADILCSNGKIMIEPNNQCIAISGAKYDLPFISGRQEAYGKMFGFFLEPLVEFLDCVRKDKPYLVNVEDGLEVTRTIVAIEKSLESGSVVDVKSVT